MSASVTIPLSTDLLEALSQRVAEILEQRPLAQRYMDSETAASYLGVPVKTLRTRSWRERAGIPCRQLNGGRLVFDRLALDRYVGS
jgi:hypothetical protein